MTKEVKSQDRKFDFSTYSHARLGMGHAGGHIKTTSWLDFQSGFAQAKDAVFSHFDTDKMIHLCQSLQLPHFIAQSDTADMLQYLTRPDLGRQLAPKDQHHLFDIVHANNNYRHQDILIVISGGLSPTAVQVQMPDLLPSLITSIKEANWSLAPIIINPRGRVALGDQLNTIFNAKLVIMLIGERPGLTTPDSLGIYFTYNPKPGCTDNMRNCISNVHAKGQSVLTAITLLRQLIALSLQKKMSGIALDSQQ